MKDRKIVSLIFLFSLSATTTAAQTQDLKKPIAKVDALRPSGFSAEFRQPIERDDSEDIAKAFLEYASLGIYDRTTLRLRSSTRKRNTKTLLVNGGAE